MSQNLGTGPGIKYRPIVDIDWKSRHSTYSIRLTEDKEDFICIFPSIHIDSSVVVHLNRFDREIPPAHMVAERMCGVPFSATCPKRPRTKTSRILSYCGFPRPSYSQPHWWVMSTALTLPIIAGLQSVLSNKARYYHAKKGTFRDLLRGVQSFAKSILPPSAGLYDRSSCPDPREPAAGSRSPERAHRRPKK